MRTKEEKKRKRNYDKKYVKTLRGKEVHRKATQKWRNSLEGKEHMIKYNRSSKRKERLRKWRKSPKRIKFMKNFCKLPQTKELHFKYRLKYTHHIGVDDYNKLFNKQHGKCAICSKLMSINKRLHIDHDHKCCPGKRSCGKCIRGLLCNRCNFILGLCDESTLVLKEAIRYIEKHRRK